MDRLTILADDNIPYVKEAFGRFGTVRTCSGRDLGRDAVREVDVLLVRSVTPVGPGLLEDSSVQFVGSATIGTDHIDHEYLREAGIHFAHAPGSNADSVADYVIVALLLLARRKQVSISERTVGIVGCGSIGSRLARHLPALGLRVLCNDPPRAEQAEENGQPHDFVDLDSVLIHADALTLHVPFTKEGPHPTHHLIGSEELDRLGDDSWLINTSRGSVVDGAALRTALHEEQIGGAVLDVWEEEPSPDPALVRAVDVATPHIAGYAIDGKARGTYMLYKAFCDFLGEAPTWEPADVLGPDHRDALRPFPPDPRLPSTDWLYHLARQGYDLSRDDAQMRAVVDEAPESVPDFTSLRSNYRRRRELQQHSVKSSLVPLAYREAVEGGIGMQLD